MMDSPKHEAYENGGTIVNRYARIAIAVLASVGLLTSASACGTSQNGAGSAHGAISVVSSINQWGTLAEQLGGSGVQVTSIINSTNVDAHDYEPTTSDIAKLQKARIVIVNGAGYDSWAVKAAQSAKSQVINAAEIGGVKDGGNPHVWFSAAVRKAVAQAITRAYEGTRPDGKADFDKLNQQWRSKEDEVARKITETKRKADGEAYAATESVAEYLAGDLGLKDATPTGYTRATANESEPTPTDIKQFTDMLEAGKADRQDRHRRQIVQYSDRGADRADAGAVRFPDGLDGRARRRVLPSHLMRTDKKDAKVDKKGDSTEGTAHFRMKRTVTALR